MTPSADTSNSGSIPRLRPPLHSRVYWYALNWRECLLLGIMCPCEECFLRAKGYIKQSPQDDSVVWVWEHLFVRLLNMSAQTVRGLMRSFRARGILTEITPATGDKRRRAPTIYRLNEAVLDEDSRMARFRVENPSMDTYLAHRRRGMVD